MHLRLRFAKVFSSCFDVLFLTDVQKVDLKTVTQEKMEGTSLCWVCCYSFPSPQPPPGEAEESTKQVTQFARQVEGSGESYKLFGEDKGLSVCPECLSVIGRAVGKREAVDEVEVQVRHLQREILRLMRSLEEMAADYLEEMRGIRDKIAEGDEAVLRSQRKMKEGDGVWALRSGVARVVEQLSRFQQDKRQLDSQIAGREPQVTVKVEANDEQLQNFEDDSAFRLADCSPAGDVSGAEGQREHKLALRRSTRSRRSAASITPSKVRKIRKIAKPKLKSEHPTAPFSGPRIFPRGHQPPWITWQQVKHSDRTRLKRYACLSCPGLEYRSSYQLEQHLREHESSCLEDPRPCPHCPLTFKHLQYWEYHVCCHENIVQSTCDTCRKTHNFFSLEAHLQEDHQVEKVLQCPNCLYRCGTSDAYLLHLRRFHADGKGIQGCYLCPSHYSARRELLQHLQDTHNLQQMIRCEEPDCGKEFVDLASLKIHQNVHLAKFACLPCNRQFPKADNLRRHMEVTHQGKRWKCRHCSKEYSSRAALAAHEPNHDEGVGNGAKWRCHLCEKAFKLESSLKTHLKWHEGEGWNCDQCGATFAFRKSFMRHRQCHEEEEPLPCEICGAVLKNQDTLRRHLKTHTDERDWECQECGKKFRDKKHLTQHQRIHSGERPFACPECGKAFNQAGTLWHHRKLVHRSVPSASTKQ